LYFLFFITEG